MSVLGTHEFTPKDSINKVTFKVTRGDYSPIMQLLVENLRMAKVLIIMLLFCDKSTMKIEVAYQKFFNQYYTTLKYLGLIANICKICQQ